MKIPKSKYSLHHGNQTEANLKSKDCLSFLTFYVELADVRSDLEETQQVKRMKNFSECYKVGKRGREILASNFCQHSYLVHDPNLLFA